MVKSYVWKYFEKVQNSSARCKFGIEDGTACGKVISCAGSSTKGLIEHLKRAHKIESEKPIETPPPAKRQRTVSECLQRQSFEEAISREVVGGLSFQQMVTSKAVRGYFKSAFPSKTFPLNGTTIAKIMREYYESTAKVETIEMIQDHLKNGKFFSVTLDEWISGAGKRYLNVNLHYIDNAGNQKINLGLKPITGKADAKNIKILVS